MSDIPIKAGLTEKEVVLFAPQKISVDNDFDYMIAIARGLVSEGHRRLVIDLGMCEKIDSHGISEIVNVYVVFREKGGSVALNNLDGRIKKLLEVCRLLELFEVSCLDYSGLSTTMITAEDVSGLRDLKKGRA